MVVLEADSFFRVIHDPAREENSAVEQFVAQVDDQADVGAGRFGPGDFVDTFPHPHNVRFLIFHPAIADDAAVNTVVEGVAIFDVNLVVPAVVVGIDQMFTDKAAYSARNKLIPNWK